MELAGKRVVITGASKGIGEGIATGFAAAGARVALVARSEAPLRALATRLGGTAHAADLTDAAARAGLIAAIEADGGPVDVLVNNAGVEVAAPIDRQSADDVSDVFQLNLVAPVELIRQVVPGMIARGSGHLVNVSSQAGAVAFPGLSTYSASKAGLSTFTRGLDLDLRGTGVGTTIVEIGTVSTDMLARIDGPGAYEPTAASFNRTYALRVQRRLSVEEVAEAVVAAVAAGAPAVRLPRRAMAFSLISAAPQRLAAGLLLGVPKRR